MKVFHLSHIDLDGYSCQLITKRCFEQINYYNSNYGKEIDQRLEQIIRDIERDIHGENLVLITDLNLTLQQAKKLVKMVDESIKNIDILLLDHHKTGADCAAKYDWYHLDVKRCATKITYDYFLEKGYDISSMEKYVDVVNAVDIWLSDSEYFELGKVYMRIVSGAREVNRILFNETNSDYIFDLLENAQEYLSVENAHIVLDDSIHGLKKSFFREEEDNTLENLVSHFVVKMLTEKRDELSVTYNGYRGILTYSIGNTSIIGNEFLVKNPDFDFFMDINGRKNISMRANNKADVSMIAKKLFNGGGHANASGGRFDDFKDSFIYDVVKEQVQDIMTIGENYE
ncbi:MAG TPA: 3'-to-5' oligoribonuclease B [Campylobacterales bacterium]|nr:3'-to-5' oligoribonuclease B [Campylobacterales bacterium]HIP59958.1 3'-to-5' oligoribonuclease B [Campylobacterales bacterium]